MFALCAELLGLFAYYVNTGALFYTHRKSYQELLPAPQDRLFLGEARLPSCLTRTPQSCGIYALTD